MSGRIYHREEQDDSAKEPQVRGHDSDGPDQSRREGAVESLHRTHGNQAVQRMVENGTVQPKLSVSDPDDPAEREAERVAEAVTGGARQSSRSTSEARSEGGSGRGSTDTESAIRKARRGGRPLPPSVRTEFEGEFGRDFGGVRVHTGSTADRAARSVDARAFTAGSDVVFRDGEYAPGTSEGKRLLAHELTHVVQQDGAGERVQRQGGDGGGTKTKSGQQSGGSGGGSGGGGGGASTMPDQASSDVKGKTWRESGNLRGDPPVRSESKPPNKHVVETRQLYDRRKGLAEKLHNQQMNRAASMVKDGTVTDFRYWFARLYERVTRNELKFAEQGNFYYPSYVLASVVYFEKVYDDNMKAFDSKHKSAEEHWQTAFQRAMKQEKISKKAYQQIINSGLSAMNPMELASLIPEVKRYVDSVVKSMLASVKAHIRYDLPRAEAWVYNNYYSQYDNTSLKDFRPDFVAMNGVFKNASSYMNQHIFDMMGIPAHLAGPLMQQIGMKYMYDVDLARERTDTWQRAKELVKQGSAGTGPYSMKGSGIQGDVTKGDYGSGLGKLGGGLAPKMGAAAQEYTDDEVRKIVNNKQGKLSDLDANARSRMIQALLQGYTAGDEQYVVKILKASIGNDFEGVVSGVGAWTIMSEMDANLYFEGNFSQVRGWLKKYYWSVTDQGTAAYVIKQAVGGGTTNWQEDLVLDVLRARKSSRGDHKEIVRTIGNAPQYKKEYGGKNAFERGLNVLKHHFQGTQDENLRDIFGRDYMLIF